MEVQRKIELVFNRISCNREIQKLEFETKDLQLCLVLLAKRYGLICSVGLKCLRAFPPPIKPNPFTAIKSHLVLYTREEGSGRCSEI